MFEQAFKNINNELRKDAGVSSELDYIEQTSWVLFLKIHQNWGGRTGGRQIANASQSQI